jgi:hypothetical protein
MNNKLKRATLILSSGIMRYKKTTTKFIHPNDKAQKKIKKRGRHHE